MDKKILHNYFSGKATTEEETQIIDWAEASPENYRQYLNERKLWDALSVNSRIASLYASRTRKFVRWKTLAAVASLAALIITGWWSFEKKPAILEEKMQTVIVPAGQRAQVVLTDGTKVWLNSKSTFTYPQTFSTRQRTVILDGEAFFEVTHQQKHPFIVSTKNYDIKVLGTTFNVYAYNEASHFETALLEGCVSISQKNSKNHLLLSEPLENAIEEHGVLKKITIQNTDRFRWTEGLICLKNETFESLMKKFSDYYDIDIEINNNHLKGYRFTGKFRQSDGIDYALNVIRKDLDFDYLRIENDYRDKIIIQ
ncbi:MAG: FecR family protein [Tannerellaceae bacterium]|jgi:ferric-dicitrate binding protein FerR (iron transport regulator)|nr:FecR family protein [Tannerellaceae bacterium]